MLIIENLTYLHPNKDLLFNLVNLTLNKQDKVALIGNNGAGKSTLLRLIAGDLQPSTGLIRTGSKPYYVPQVFGQFNDLTISGALRVSDKLNALADIINGNVTESNLASLNDDWTIEERCRNALTHWNLDNFDLTQKMKHLSGGQQTKVFLAGISIHNPDIILLDEPTNHLDKSGRELLYDLVRSSMSTLIVVSHDRKLINMLDRVCEIDRAGITVYGGNYDFYAEQKMIQNNALDMDLKSMEKELRKAREIERETVARKQKMDARGKKKQERSGLPTISMNTFRNNAEKSTARMRDVHAEKVGAISQELQTLRKELPDCDKMKFGFESSALHKGKKLIIVAGINHGYGKCLLWKEPLNFEITSGERIAINGLNGSGKTTLLKIILGEIEPLTGTVNKTINDSVYIDQDYSLVDNALKVYEQAQKFNVSALQEHEIKIRLRRFLFTEQYWDKPCSTLSGGEKMRLVLCCLTIRNQAPDMIVLDEPTNNLDMQNIEILTGAINEYMGTLMVISHDQYFLEQVQVNRTIELHQR